MAIFPRLSLDESTAEPKSLAKSRNTLTHRRRRRRADLTRKLEPWRKVTNGKLHTRREVTNGKLHTRREVTNGKLHTWRAGAEEEKRESVPARGLPPLPAKKKNQVYRKHHQKFFFFGTQSVLFHNENEI